MSNIKEAIELMEKAKQFTGTVGCSKRLDQAIAKLLTEPEPTKWTAFIEYLELNQKLYCLEYDDHRIANITKEQFEDFEQLLAKLSTEQPPASDFTEKLRNFVKMYENEIPRRAEITFLKEACTRLDRSEASRKDLLTALERISDIEDKRYTHCGFDLEVNNISKAAIAKEKEVKI